MAGQQAIAKRTLAVAKLEIGHNSNKSDKVTKKDHTHEWVIFIRGLDNVKMELFVEKVVFDLHIDYSPQQRVFYHPPYQVSETGYAGFFIPINIYFRNIFKPQTFEYDLTLGSTRLDNVKHVQVTFLNPPQEFLKLFLEGGGTIKDPDESMSIPLDKLSIMPTATISNHNNQQKKSKVHSSANEFSEKSSSKGKAASRNKRKNSTIKNVDKTTNSLVPVSGSKSELKNSSSRSLLESNSKKDSSASVAVASVLTTTSSTTTSTSSLIATTVNSSNDIIKNEISKSTITNTTTTTNLLVKQYVGGHQPDSQFTDLFGPPLQATSHAGNNKNGKSSRKSLQLVEKVEKEEKSTNNNKKISNNNKNEINGNHSSLQKESNSLPAPSVTRSKSKSKTMVSSPTASVVAVAAGSPQHHSKLSLLARTSSPTSTNIVKNPGKMTNGSVIPAQSSIKNKNQTSMLASNNVSLSSSSSDISKKSNKNKDDRKRDSKSRSSSSSSSLERQKKSKYNDNDVLSSSSKIKSDNSEQINGSNKCDIPANIQKSRSSKSQSSKSSSVITSNENEGENINEKILVNSNYKKQPANDYQQKLDNLHDLVQNDNQASMYLNANGNGNDRRNNSQSLSPNNSSIREKINGSNLEQIDKNGIIAKPGDRLPSDDSGIDDLSPYRCTKRKLDQTPDGSPHLESSKKIRHESGSSISSSPSSTGSSPLSTILIRNGHSSLAVNGQNPEQIFPMNIPNQSLINGSISSPSSSSSLINSHIKSKVMISTSFLKVDSDKNLANSRSPTPTNDIVFNSKIKEKSSPSKQIESSNSPYYRSPKSKNCDHLYGSATNNDSNTKNSLLSPSAAIKMQQNHHFNDNDSKSNLQDQSRLSCSNSSINSIGSGGHSKNKQKQMFNGNGSPSKSNNSTPPSSSMIIQHQQHSTNIINHHYFDTSPKEQSITSMKTMINPHLEDNNSFGSKKQEQKQNLSPSASLSLLMNKHHHKRNNDKENNNGEQEVIKNTNNNLQTSNIEYRIPRISQRKEQIKVDNKINKKGEIEEFIHRQQHQPDIAKKNFNVDKNNNENEDLYATMAEDNNNLKAFEKYFNDDDDDDDDDDGKLSSRKNRKEKKYDDDTKDKKMAKENHKSKIRNEKHQSKHQIDSNSESKIKIKNKYSHDEKKRGTGFTDLSDFDEELGLSNNFEEENYIPSIMFTEDSESESSRPGSRQSTSNQIRMSHSKHSKQQLQSSYNNNNQHQNQHKSLMNGYGSQSNSPISINTMTCYERAASISPAQQISSVTSISHLQLDSEIIKMMHKYLLETSNDHFLQEIIDLIENQHPNKVFINEFGQFECDMLSFDVELVKEMLKVFVDFKIF